MKIRRVVTGRSGVKSKIVSDGPSRKSHAYVNIPGNTSHLLWATSATPQVPLDETDTVSEKTLYVPPVGETRLMIVTFPPDSVMMSPSFNPAAAGQEFMEHMPELAQTFEMENPGMHTTDTVDYGCVLEGEVWLEVDDGKQVHLKQHDVIVQGGVRHAWRNKTDKPVKILFVLVGARRKA